MEWIEIKDDKFPSGLHLFLNKGMIMPDGDIIELYINKKSMMEFHCFSGAPGSFINISNSDFGYFNIDFDKSFTEQCFQIAEQLWIKLYRQNESEV